MKLLRMLGFATLVLCAAIGIANAQTWTRLTNYRPPMSARPFCSTDGTVLVHAEQSSTANWYRLTPDINGSYVNGTLDLSGVLAIGIRASLLRFRRVA